VPGRTSEDDIVVRPPYDGRMADAPLDASGVRPSSRALVLAGGGLVGIGWETGVVLGLADGGLPLDTWDPIIGTSAGSVVGAALGTSDGLERLAHTDWVGYGRELATYMAGLDRQAVARIDALWFGSPDGADQATRAEIGRLARAAVTGPSERFERALASILPDRAWPAALVITAVDAEDGSLRRFDVRSGVPLVKAVAASCAVPGVFPPIEIGGRLYVDGGVRSGSGLDLALGCRWIIGVAPTRQDGHGERQLTVETAVLETAGATVRLVRPGPEADAIFDVDSLDVARLPEAVRVGRSVGRAAAEAARAEMGL